VTLGAVLATKLVSEVDRSCIWVNGALSIIGASGELGSVCANGPAPRYCPGGQVHPDVFSSQKPEGGSPSELLGVAPTSGHYEQQRSGHASPVVNTRLTRCGTGRAALSLGIPPRTKNF
jgi:hypothetical protein